MILAFFSQVNYPLESCYWFGYGQLLSGGPHKRFVSKTLFFNGDEGVLSQRGYASQDSIEDVSITRNPHSGFGERLSSGGDGGVHRFN